ncbi:MAG: hypothetical protein H8E55_17035 [Pelagibacterales bacterium]|nr:hypothetical protein [Pelagibacterales bacterium]
MTDKWKYKSVSLKNSTYSLLNDLTKTLVPGMELSNAKTVETLIKRETECNSSGDQQLKELNEGNKEI